MGFKQPVLNQQTLDAVRAYFEPQLERIGLSVEQIEHQMLDELEVSLSNVNAAIEHPESFGSVSLSFAVKEGAVTPILSTPSEAQMSVGALPLLLERKSRILRRIGIVPPSASRALGILRIEIHGGWSVADLIKLLGRLEDGYKAAAALESLTERPSGSALSRLSADDLLQTVTAFRLAGGLRLGSLHYGSPGYLEVIGEFNPLKNFKDVITENRTINLKRDEARRLDERERERQATEHEEAMARERRMSEQQQQSYALEAARIRIAAEAGRFNMMKDLIDRLPADQGSVAAAQLLQLLMGATEAIAVDARIDGARMLEQADDATLAPSTDVVEVRERVDAPAGPGDPPQASTMPEVG